MVIDITILISFLLFLVSEYGIDVLDKIIYIGVIMLLLFEVTKTIKDFIDYDRPVFNSVDLTDDLETLEKELEDSRERTRDIEQAIENVKKANKKDIEIVHDSSEFIIIKKIGKLSNENINTLVKNLLEPQVKI